jgi:ABC-type Fe3+ transport system permease subunit
VITLVTVTLIVLFSAVIGCTLAWVIARTVLDALDGARRRLQPLPAVRMPTDLK